jgi:putative oxidoreductase
MSAIGVVFSLYNSAVSGLRFLTWLPPLVARISIGWVFMQTGWGKVTHIPDVVENFRGWGIPLPEYQAPLAAYSELVFGTMLAFGLFTRICSIPLMIIMCVAIAKVKYKGIDEASDLFNLSEYLFIVLLLWLLVYGGGVLSLDRLLLKLRRKGTAGSEPAH